MSFEVVSPKIRQYILAEALSDFLEHTDYVIPELTENLQSVDNVYYWNSPVDSWPYFEAEYTVLSSGRKDFSAVWIESTFSDSIRLHRMHVVDMNDGADPLWLRSHNLVPFVSFNRIGAVDVRTIIR